MKKSLLFLTLMFSLWSFALVKFISVEMPMFNPVNATPEKEAKPKASSKKAVSSKKAAAAMMMPPLTPAQYPLGKDSQWSYLDSGTSLDGTTWGQPSYDVSGWATGSGPLGYGDPANTVISFGPDSGNKYITSYFVRDIEINLATLPEFVEFGMRRDDGAVVYINGVEAYRDNMPEGAFTYLTHSATIVDGADEKRYFTHLVPKTAFHEGINRIAVEVHNRDGQSSDLGFDLYVKDPVENMINCEENHLACFTSIAPTGQTPNMLIPQEHRFQLLFKQGDTYTDGTGTVPGNHDFTGYIPTGGSSTTGYLSVNHENGPGGVSILDMHFDEETKLWVMEQSRRVDLYNAALVTTTRNCSGGVTPWETVITAEESTAPADVNGDGYADEGWLVEIDPVTAQVKDYGSGQQKLWAMGRMNHENVVVSNDGSTAYYGEDGGTHCVYKFIADTPGNLTSGKVYVLKMNLPLSSDEPSSSTGTWIEVPNTTQADRNNLNTIAGTLGGTNFNGVEDCEISPLDGKVYFTSKGKNRVYRFKDNGATVSDFETFVGGMTYPLETAEGVVEEEWADGNDNLTFDDKGNLWVLQDGGLNYIWVVRPDHRQDNPKVLLHSSMPAGSEPTGLTFTPDFKYGFFSVQHPDGANTPQTDATFGQVSLNASATVVFALQENLGAQTPQADFTASDVTVAEGETVTFTDLSTNNPTNWEWTFEGGTPATSTEESPTVTYAEAGTYAVTLKSSNAAGNTEVTKAAYIAVEEVAGTGELQLGDKVNIYPNPTDGRVTIALNDAAGQDVSIEVYDLVGRKLSQVSGVQTTGVSQNVELDLSVYAGEQVFIIKLQLGDKTGSYKLLKVK